MNLIPLVSDRIYEFDLCKDMVNCYYELVKNSNDINYSCTDSYNVDPSNKYVSVGYPIPKHLELFDSMQKCIDEVSLIKFQEKNQMISDVWIVKSKFGDQSRGHMHNFSILSGILYLQDHSTPTEFIIEDNFYKKFSQNSIFTNFINNFDKITIEPKLGKLIIFPSYLYHQVGMNRSKQTRYTLAFNTFFTGNLSDKPGSKLKFNLI
jgi:uncharacterized protein (TIGR02466 family)